MSTQNRVLNYHMQDLGVQFLVPQKIHAYIHTIKILKEEFRSVLQNYPWRK